MLTYDAIVLGTGGVGSAALYHLARRGYRVLGLDRFPGGHDRGSSHGQTRIIRQAYFEHPDYVPLVKRAYELWAELEERSGEQLFDQAGIIEIGPEDGVLVSGVLGSAAQHGLEVEKLDAAQVAKRWPGFHVPDDSIALFEPKAGILQVERCVLNHLDQAVRAGAELRTDVSVTGWASDAGSIKVTTANEVFRSDRLVITAGAWSEALLGDLGIRLPVRRKHLHWYHCDDPRYRRDQGCCGFFYETPDGLFYGFPQVDDLGVKVSQHSGGTIIDDPLTDDRSIEPADRKRVESFLRRHLPGVSDRPTDHAVCYYTMSADEHFIVDRLPDHDGVAFAAGLSGLGFKFTSVLGQILAELVTDGTTALPIDFLAWSRPGLREDTARTGEST